MHNDTPKDNIIVEQNNVNEFDAEEDMYRFFKETIEQNNIKIYWFSTETAFLFGNYKHEEISTYEFLFERIKKLRKSITSYMGYKEIVIGQDKNDRNPSIY